eukprot:TRINITY_DN49921_c0_g1_i1.p1 TRINITY_DN49921_c0_g1~~TRINITY_DN49921_c0_g1_i1.p1  ORF type:complete len:537 (+),score=191.92 TRINITY_DN49921_c0_g1_i1:77-1612(+)
MSRGEPRKLTEAEAVAVRPLRRGWENHPAGGKDLWVPQGQIEGTVPPELHGTFFRNGPGLNAVHGTPLKHPIDGDGLVCALSISRGRAHFRSRFVQTFSHAEEQRAGRMIYPGQMGTRPPPGGKRKFRDMAHTNVFHWGGKLLACHEYTLPHCLDPATLETVGPDQLGGTFNDTRAFAAHFRIDQRLNRLVTVGFKPGPPGGRAALRIVEYDERWQVTRAATHRIPGLNYVHDLLVSPSWYVVQMTPFVKVSPELVKEIMTGKTTPGEQMRLYPDMPCRLVFIERSPGPGRAARVVQLDTEPCHIYHFGYCVESQCGNKLELNAACLPEGFNMFDRHGLWLANVDEAIPKLYRFDADLAAGTLRRALQDPACCEFPTVHPLRQVAGSDCPRPRYTYTMAADGGAALPFRDIVKVDHLSPSGRQAYHAGQVVGEPQFAPRLGAASAQAGDEDDGWLIAQEYDSGRHETAFIVLDAKDLAKGPVCRIRLGFHVPYPFHGTWCPEVFLGGGAKL